MSTFPMEITRISLDHQGGTKSYHIIYITAADYRSMLIKRWGKTREFGTIKVETYDTVKHGERAFASIAREKQRGGYREVSSDTKIANDQDELMKIVGRAAWSKLSADNILHLLPGASVNGVRDPDPPRFDEEGNFLGNPEPRKVVITEEMKEQARLAKIEEQRKKNPLFGRF